MTVRALGVILLGVAVLSLCVYTGALVQLLTRSRQPGLVRTAACRVCVELVYVGFAVAALHGVTRLPVVALCVFIGTRLVWQSNAILDVRLTRRNR